jgi:hypothetical protein
MFIKGVSGHPEGRPKGTKNKGHLLATYWLAKAELEWPKMKPFQRAIIACRIACALLGKQMAHLTPEESVKNATSAMETLKFMEGLVERSFNSGPGAGCGEIGVADGQPEIQAPIPTAPSV